MLHEKSLTLTGRVKYKTHNMKEGKENKSHPKSYLEQLTAQENSSSVLC